MKMVPRVPALTYIEAVLAIASEAKTFKKI